MNSIAMQELALYFICRQYLHEYWALLHTYDSTQHEQIERRRKPMKPRRKRNIRKTTNKTPTRKEEGEKQDLRTLKA